MHKQNWDDLRYLLAVAQNGSVSAAARLLGVNHATVLRHISAFEARHGVEIFERSAQGYRIAPDKLRLLEAAREVEVAMGAVDRIVQSDDTRVAGAVRVTSTDTFCMGVLPRVLADMQGQGDGLRFELQCTNAHLDLARLNADIAVRPAETLSNDVAGEPAGMLGFAVYSAGGQGGLPWLLPTGALGRSCAAQWLDEHAATARVSGSADSFPVLQEMAAEGLGQAILPICLADSDSRLGRIGAGLPEMLVPIWVVSHVEMANAPRLRRIRDRLAAGLLAQSTRLAGS